MDHVHEFKDNKHYLDGNEVGVYKLTHKDVWLLGCVVQFDRLEEWIRIDAPKAQPKLI